MQLYQNSLAYFSAHPMLNSIAHAAGGFGLAVLLQHYLKGDAFVSPWFGWACIVVSILIHVHSFMKK